VNLARAARESFAHVVCRLRGMVMEEERAPEKVEGEWGGGGCYDM
jgi:hypothetical protein